MEEEAAPGSQPGTLHAKIHVSELTLSQGHLSGDVHGVGSRPCMHAWPRFPAATERGAERWSVGMPPACGGAEGLLPCPVHSPGGRQHPRAQAWPVAGVQLCGTRLLPRRRSGADLALSAVLQGKDLHPFGPKAEGRVRCRRWPQCCQRGHGKAAGGSAGLGSESGSLLEDGAHCTPSLQASHASPCCRGQKHK